MVAHITGKMLADCFGKAFKHMTLEKLAIYITDELASAQMDMDISGNIDDAAYYAGMVDAFETVMLWIAPVTNMKELNKLLGKLDYDKFDPETGLLLETIKATTTNLKAVA